MVNGEKPLGYWSFFVDDQGMSISLRSKDGELPQNGSSRIACSADVADVFRQLRRKANKSTNELLEEMMRRYIKSEKLKLEIVER